MATRQQLLVRVVVRLIVDRTCTEVGVDDTNRVRLGESKSLAEFRPAPALVLLGDPGAGKTTEFEREREALDGSGDRAVYVKAPGLRISRSGFASELA